MLLSENIIKYMKFNDNNILLFYSNNFSNNLIHKRKNKNLMLFRYFVNLCVKKYYLFRIQIS